MMISSQQFQGGVIHLHLGRTDSNFSHLFRDIILGRPLRDLLIVSLADVGLVDDTTNLNWPGALLTGLVVAVQYPSPVPEVLNLDVYGDSGYDSYCLWMRVLRASTDPALGFEPRVPRA